MTTVNISKVKDRSQNNVTPSTVYNPPGLGSVTDGSYMASTTYHQAPQFRPTLSPAPFVENSTSGFPMNQID